MLPDCKTRQLFNCVDRWKYRPGFSYVFLDDGRIIVTHWDTLYEITGYTKDDDPDFAMIVGEQISNCIQYSIEKNGFFKGNLTIRHKRGVPIGIRALLFNTRDFPLELHGIYHLI